jgi:hypothetical protein
LAGTRSSSSKLVTFGEDARSLVKGVRGLRERSLSNRLSKL